MIAELDSTAGPQKPATAVVSETQRLQILLYMIQANIVLYKAMSKTVGAEACLPIIEEIEQIISNGLMKPK